MAIDLTGVADRLERVRLALGLGKGEFAASFELDASSYSKIIRGDKPLKAEMAFLISERWGVSMDYLYRGRLDALPESLASKLRTTDTLRQP